MAEPILDRSKIEIKLGEYGVSSYTHLSDQALIAQARDFKRSLSSRMYPLDKEGISKKIANSDYYVSRKLDGEFSLLIKSDDELFTLNPGGTVRTGMPWMKEAAESLQQAKVSRAVIAGELYVQSNSKQRTRVHDVVSIARNPKNDSELSQLAFAVFDIVSLEGDSQIESDFDDIWASVEKLATGSCFSPGGNQTGQNFSGYQVDL